MPLLSPALDHDRHCAEIVAQTAVLTDHLDGADLAAAVPGCPGWNLAQLVRHTGAGHRWATTIVRTAAAQPPPDTAARELSPDPDVDREALAEWLVTGAHDLAEALRTTGPDAPVWTPGPHGTSAFWARRFAHETVVHTADAALAVGAPFVPDRLVAVDCVDEWLELLALPEQLDADPRKRELLGPGRVLRFRATEPGPDTGAAGVPDWLVDLTGDVLCWRRTGSEGTEAAVTVHGPLAELLLLLYRRRPVPGTAVNPASGTASGTASEAAPARGVTVDGDVELLRFWLDRVGFG